MGYSSNQIYTNNGVEYLNDKDYETYMRLFGNPSAYVHPMYVGVEDSYHTTDPQGNVGPVNRTLSDYVKPSDNTLEPVYRGLASAPAIYGAGAAGWWGGPAAALWLTAGGLAANALHGRNATPADYQTLTDKGRSDYLREMATPQNRAVTLSGELSSMAPNPDDERLTNYLGRVLPYEDMVYYNPKTLAGKGKAYAYSQWARQRIKDRWREDMDAIEAQEMAEKYGLDLPDRYKEGGPFRVDPSSFK